MNRWSSDKKMKLLFENFRGFTNEVEEPPAAPAAPEAAAPGAKKWPSEYPAEGPTNLTTADLSPEEFVQMIEDWGATPVGPSDMTAKVIFKKLGGRDELKKNYALLQKRVANANAKGGLLPRKYMPVVKKGFVEDLFNRLKAGKLDVNEPFAPTSADVGDIELGDLPGGGKEARIKSKKARKKAKQDKRIKGKDIAAPTNERLSSAALRKYIKEVLTEATPEEFARYKALRGGGLSPSRQSALKAQGFSSAEQAKFAAQLPAENFPSLADFQAMDDPKKSKDYWLNKGEFDDNPTDDVLKPKFGTMSVSELTPSQDRVYADKIGWKLLQYGAGVLAPDKDLGDPGTGPQGTGAPDWRYRSIAIMDGKLLDGHHKWALASLSGSNFKVPVLYLPIKDLATTINLLRSYGAAQGFEGQA